MVNLLMTLLVIIFGYQPQNTNGTLTQTAASFWDKIMNQMPEKPKLLIRFQNGRKTKQKLIKWDKNKIDSSKGPYAYLCFMANKLLRNKDISQCELQYYEDAEPLSIDDDDSILDLLQTGPDMAGNKRLIDIICDDEEYMESNMNTIYRKAVNAYNYAVMSNSEPSSTEKEFAENKLKKANLAGYSLQAEGIALIHVNGDEFIERATEIANAYNWDQKTQSIINTVPVSSKVFQSRSYVSFDAANWRIIGSFVRFAGWKSNNEADKMSMYVSTSKFEFSVPRNERDGNIADKYLYGSGGTISHEYMEYIKTILRYKAIEASKQDLNKPDPAEWALEYDFKADL